jgi:serine/threonine protein kinase
MFFTSYAFMFHIKRYEMDLRTYLIKHRDYRKLSEILLQVVAGLKELHGLGFVHRDLKPENIVLDNGHPIKVALIDFDRSLPITSTCKTGTRGTPGYQPDNAQWFDGDVMWDIYSLVCIIAECDMEKDLYKKAKDERGAKSMLRKHIEAKSTDINISEIVHQVLLDYKGLDDPSLDHIAARLKQTKFQKQV